MWVCMYMCVGTCVHMYVLHVCMWYICEYMYVCLCMHVCMCVRERVTLGTCLDHNVHIYI